MISPETEEQAAAIVHELDQAGIGWRALGSGSNVLADDGEHHYVVLSLKDLKGECRFDGELVSVRPAIRCHVFALMSRDKGCRALKVWAEFQERSAARCG